MAMAWMILEIFVYYIFLLTMLIILVKAFFGLGIAADNSKMFRGKHLVFMLNKLIKTFMEKTVP